eukprot:5178341-Alexandrium_andersonii.AAC.1
MFRDSNARSELKPLAILEKRLGPEIRGVHFAFESTDTRPHRAEELVSSATRSNGALSALLADCGDQPI